MNNKIKILTLSLSLLLGLSNSALASKLPNDVWKYVQNAIPKAKQRFDSVVVVNDDVMYIPLTPPTNTTVNEIKIDYTYPQNAQFSALPEVVLLNNGYSFLKVFKDAKGDYTLTKKDDLPLKVRLGLMPQDMLTPIGLKMPESLKLTLGDLLIPSKEEGSLALKENEKEKERTNAHYNPAVKRNEFIASAEFINKKIFINPKNSKFIEIYDSKSKTPLYELKLSSMPQKIISSDVSHVALVTYWSGKNVEIIDLKDERIITSIALDSTASDVVLNKTDNIAYVASQNANAIYVINLTSMQLDKVIKLDQKPSKIAYCEEDKTLAFYDEFSSKVYSLSNLNGELVVQTQGIVENASKVLIDKNQIYALSRTQHELYVFDKTQNKLINSMQLSQKPTDALIHQNKIFILCSKDGYLDVYDIKEGIIVSKEQLSKNGFYSTMTYIPGNNILITGINSKNYLIYNIEKMKLSKVQESYIDVNNIIILDKTQRL